MFCSKCGKEVSDDASFCPACGNALKTELKQDSFETTNNSNMQNYSTPSNHTEVKKTNGLGIAGFILSLVSLFLSFFCIIPVIGLVISVCGLVKGNREQMSTGLATAGTIISTISLVFSIISLIVGITAINVIL